MKNITVAIPTETWRVARLWCAQNDTSLSEMVSGMLYILPRLKPKGKELYKMKHRQAIAREANGRFARRDPAVVAPSPNREATVQPAVPAAQSAAQTEGLPADPAAPSASENVENPL